MCVENASFLCSCIPAFFYSPRSYLINVHEINCGLLPNACRVSDTCREKMLTWCDCHVASPRTTTATRVVLSISGAQRPQMAALHGKIGLWPIYHITHIKCNYRVHFISVLLNVIWNRTDSGCLYILNTICIFREIDRKKDNIVNICYTGLRSSVG